MDKELILEPMADILIESMRSIGYSFESAIADIIDNSISANAKNIKLFFNPTDCHISIIDDGCGMNYSELKNAMRWGSKDPLLNRQELDLGRFGLGLKSASLSLCRKLTVVSKVDNEINGMRWDLDYVRGVNKWAVINLTKDDINSLPDIAILNSLNHGTYVQWNDFDKVKVTSDTLVSTIEDLLAYAIDYLSLIYHIFINEGLKIEINGRMLEKIDPFLRNNTFTQSLKADPLTIYDNDGIPHEIKIEPYVLPHFNSLSPTEKQMLHKNNNLYNKPGFYIYRNKRLIVWGSWFRMANDNETYKNARVKVQIPNSLDDIWCIDVKKSSATIPPKYKKQLFYAVKEAISTSQKIFKQRSINVNKQLGYKCVWDVIRQDDNTIYKINRNLPIIESFAQTLEDEQITMLDLILSDIENNIPKYAIFTQIANDNDKNNDTYENVKNRVITFLSLNRITNISLFDEFIKPLLESEPYCIYDSLYEDVKKEFFKHG